MESIVSGLLSDFESGRVSRRDLVKKLTMAAAVTAAGVPTLAKAAAPASPFKAISVNHISYNVADYAKSRDFYSELLGMSVSKDNGKQALLSFGDSILVVRNARTPEAKGTIDHMAYAIANWDEAKVKAELEALTAKFEPMKPHLEAIHTYAHPKKPSVDGNVDEKGR